MVSPKVSVLMPIYNTNLEHLKESIESILSQTFTDFELIILNDSPDNKELEKFVKSYDDKRIVYAKNKHNMGITPSRNKLLDMASGEYIAIFDHDDISLPQRLEKEIDILDTHSNIGLVSGWEKWFGDKQDIFKTPETDVDIRIMMTADNYISHTACMIRKSVLDEHHIRYKEEYSPAEDYKLCSDLMNVTELYNIQEPLVMYRRYVGNTSQKQRNKIRNMAQKIRLENSNKYPAYRNEYENKCNETEIKLFGFIPFLNIKNKKGRKYIYLCNLLPIFKIQKDKL